MYGDICAQNCFIPRLERGGIVSRTRRGVVDLLPVTSLRSGLRSKDKKFVLQLGCCMSGLG